MEIRSMIVTLCLLVLTPLCFEVAWGAEISKHPDLAATPVAMHNWKRRLHKNMQWHEVLRSIQGTYGKYISIEYHTSHDSKKVAIKGKGVPYRMGWVAKDFSLSKQTTLGEALRKFCNATKDSFELEAVESQLCLLPLNDAGERIATCLDKRISLALEKVSTEVAIATLVEAYNTAYPDETIIWETSAEQMLWKMPGPFYTVENICIDVDEATVREILCGIYDQSPIVLRYHFRSSKRFLMIDTNFKMPMLKEEPKQP